jgi:hypothetical protein
MYTIIFDCKTLFMRTWIEDGARVCDVISVNLNRIGGSLRTETSVFYSEGNRPHCGVQKIKWSCVVGESSHLRTVAACFIFSNSINVFRARITHRSPSASSNSLINRCSSDSSTPSPNA